MSRPGSARRCVLLAVAITLLALAGNAAASRIVSRGFASRALQQDWTYDIYLPSGYESATRDYPVLYLLHGNGDDRGSWVRDGHIQQTADALIAAGDIPPCLIVMPDGGTSWYVDRKVRMESALIEDLIPDVEQHWRALARRDGRVVGGYSMGGYGAMRLALRYPERFAAAALLSPAIYDPLPPEHSAARKAGVFGAANFVPAIWKEYNYPALWNAYLARRLPVAMFIDSGDADPFGIEQEATRFYLRLRRDGQPAQLRIVHGAHDWSVWAGTIGDAMKYVFGHAGRVPAAAPAR